MTDPYRTPGERPLGPRWGATWKARLYARLFVRHYRSEGSHVRVIRVWGSGCTTTRTRTWDAALDRSIEAACSIDEAHGHALAEMAKTARWMATADPRAWTRGIPRTDDDIYGKPNATPPHEPGRPVDE